MNIHEKTLREAIDAIASDVGNRQHDNTVTTRDAFDYVDHDLACAWATRETGLRSPQLIIAEAFEHLTDAQALSVLTCLLNQTDTARKILAEHLRQYIAADLAYDAQKVIDNFDPTDAEMARGYPDASVRAEYRTMARDDARAYRRNGDEL